MANPPIYPAPPDRYDRLFTGTVLEATRKAIVDAAPNTFRQTGGVVRTVDAKLRETVSVKDFGAVGDGAADDTAAIQAAVNFCFGTAASPHGTNATLNSPLYFPPGNYKITAPITFRSVRGAHIYGAGRFTTKITQTAVNSACFVTNGFEYSRVEGMYFNAPSGASSIAFDLNWDNTGTTALQSNTFSDCFFESAGIGIELGRGGYMGSETTFLNCFFQATVAGLKTSNYNALQESVIGGNFQACGIGIWVYAGSVPIICGVGFQSNPTYDIFVENSANDAYTITGCRSESVNFLGVSPAVTTVAISGCSHVNVNNGNFAGGSGQLTIDGCYSQKGAITGNQYGSACIRASHFVRTDYLDAYSGSRIISDLEWIDGAVAYTALKANVTNTASAAASNLIDMQINGVSKFLVDKYGQATFGYSVSANYFNAGSAVQFGNGTFMSSPANGIYKITSSDQATKGVIVTAPFVVATLPAAATAGAGARAFVTDANATTFMSVVAGGGSNGVPVVSDGTNWRIG